MIDFYWFLFAIPGLLLSLGAQLYLKGTYNKYGNTGNTKGLTGLDAAKIIIAGEGLDITTQFVPGQLSDSYDSANNVMSLSASSANQASIGAVAVSAHELGHALQDQKGSALMAIRNVLVPIVNIGSQLGYYIIIVGLIISYFNLALIGLALFSLSLVFTLITLPIEIDASNRALGLIQKYQLLSPAEYTGGKRVLTAAALTYVAGVVSSFSQVLYFALQVLGLRSRDN